MHIFGTNTKMYVPKMLNARLQNFVQKHKIF